MNWVVAMIIGSLVISAVLNLIVHAVFFISGGRMDDGDEKEANEWVQ